MRRHTGDPLFHTEVHWNSRLVSDNAVEEVHRLKAAGDGVMEVGGANLAASLISHGPVDEYQLFLSPVVLGGGTPMFPTSDLSLHLRLVETRQFAIAVMLRYLAE